MRLVLIDYGSGNLHSAQKAFALMGRDAGVSSIEVTADPDAVLRADRIVLPGDGAFPSCRAAFEAQPGLHEALADAVLRRGVPFMGICVGMQMMATRGLEHGETPGFDWFPGEVRRIEPADPALKIPHMGWNALEVLRPHPLLDGIASGDHAYFVHSYHLAAARPQEVLATTDHGGTVTAAVARDNLAGMQFHPEKSQATGLRLIANFLAWKP